MDTSVQKRKLNDDDEDDDSRPPKIVPTDNSNKPITVYILPDCIGPKRLGIMQHSVDTMGFTLSTRMTY